MDRAEESGQGQATARGTASEIAAQRQLSAHRERRLIAGIVPECETEAGNSAWRLRWVAIVPLNFSRAMTIPGTNKKQNGTASAVRTFRCGRVGLSGIRAGSRIVNRFNSRRCSNSTATPAE